MLIGIIGVGSMGSGIGQVAATAGHDVLMYDSNEQMISKSKQLIATNLQKLVDKGKINSDTATSINNRISPAYNLQKLALCDLVIEAIIEDIGIKQKVFAELETYVSAECVLATNTSSLSVTAIAAACRNPYRVIGIHFFNPATLMELVEIIPAVQTDVALVAKAKSWIESWGKRCVIAKDTPGFIVNRIARPYYGEAIRIYEEGIADIATIDWAMTSLGGFRMGPFTLMDFIGNDVNYAVTESVFKSFFYDPRYRPSFTQKRLSEAGWLGRKSGKGYYDYSEGVIMPQPIQDTALGQNIFNRIIAMLINEAADALYLNIASQDDIETAMTKGTNYPKGLLAWGEAMGYGKILAILDDLYDNYHEDRYRASIWLRKKAV